MKDFVVPTPMFDKNMAVVSYQLSDYNVNRAFGLKNDFQRMNEAFYSPGLDEVRIVGVEPFSGDKPLFANVNTFQLLSGIPANMGFGPNKIISVLPTDAYKDNDLLQKCANMKVDGYKFALGAFPKGGNDNPIVPLMDYILMDYTSKDFFAWYRQMTMFGSKMKHVQPVITNIPDLDAYRSFRNDNKGIFAGEFYSRPLTKGNSMISPIKMNVLQLLNRVNQDDFDLMDVVVIIERDPYLSMSLLRFINSDAVSLSREVESIRGAVAILGQKEVRQWATVALSVSLAEDRPSEITKLSLVRAKFAEQLAAPFQLEQASTTLFMAGLFSLIDIILQKPMDEALREVALNETIRSVLLGKEKNRLNNVFDFIYEYERGDWEQVATALYKNDLDPDAVHYAYVGALLWYRQLLTAIDADKGNKQAAQEQK